MVWKLGTKNQVCFFVDLLKYYWVFKNGLLWYTNGSILEKKASKSKNFRKWKPLSYSISCVIPKTMYVLQKRYLFIDFFYQKSLFYCSLHKKPVCILYITIFFISPKLTCNTCYMPGWLKLAIFWRLLNYNRFNPYSWLSLYLWNIWLTPYNNSYKKTKKRVRMAVLLKSIVFNFKINSSNLGR